MEYEPLVYAVGRLAEAAEDAERQRNEDFWGDGSAKRPRHIAVYENGVFKPAQTGFACDPQLSKHYPAWPTH